MELNCPVQSSDHCHLTSTINTSTTVLNEPASDPASGSMKTILHSLSRDFSGPGREGRLAVANRYSLDSEESRKGSPFYSSGAALANYQFEMNKLLKCNYTGVASLFWCDTNTNN